jgi:hypothetical protein
MSNVKKNVNKFFHSMLHNFNFLLYIYDVQLKSHPTMQNYSIEDLYKLADVDVLPSQLGIFNHCDTYDPLEGQVRELAEKKVFLN